ncbi:AAT-domain-containing protein [Durotheca rogersii]|uniref:AAT-domain-containing protein n=1 Tax=Durotheca rogersii TaxID=419775 RepID=UPI0022204FD3|nr:AAT-domain-containing protein [Durotheca rogersii]KAI5862247.1 AAT-domain-containing protein [Durotheca rogersii]
MLEIWCSGTPHEIGLAHGRQAKDKVAGSVAFYKQLFQETCALGWDEALREAERYVAPLEALAPRHLAEIRGIAEGAALPFLDVLALNVRSEINFGLFTDEAAGRGRDVPSDGCTSLGWLVPPGDGGGGGGGASSSSFLSQNWDWRAEQAPHLVVCHIAQPGTAIPDLVIVTEAGIVGKIGLNAAGVGVGLNAIRCRGVDRAKLPVHLALRAVLEAPSRAEAVRRIRAAGVAVGAHLLVGDATGATGLECTSWWVRELAMDARGRVAHSNHLTLAHPDVEEPPWLADSPARLARIRALTAAIARPDAGALFDVYKDLDGYPASINRKQEGVSKSQTLFTIIMNLTAKTAQVTFGRPTEYSTRVFLSF